MHADDIDVLAAVYSAVVPDGAPSDGAAQMALAIERLAPPRAKRLRLLLRGLRALGFVRRSRDARGRMLRSMAASPLPDLRTGYAALVRLAAFLAYASDDGERNRLWERIGYPGPREDLPPAPEPHPRADVAPPERVDAIVIGSGAGGGSAAVTFARAGLRVAVFEGGPWPDAIARRQRERDAFADLYLESGLCATTDLGLSMLAGACVGGGTAVNWTTSLRLSDAVARQWERSSGVEFAESLRPHYEALELELDLRPAASHNPNNAAILRGADALGWHAIAQPRNASCTGDGCGYCGFGCAYATKRSTDRTFLREVLDRGGFVVGDAPVEGILVEDGVAVGVRVRIDGASRDVRATTVACAGGALRTPSLLATAGVRSTHLGAHLHVHPTCAILAEFDAPVEPWRGPTQSALCDEFAALDDAYGVVLEAAPAHPGLAALAVPWLGRDAHAAEMERIARTAALIAIVRDRGEGRVGTGAAPAVDYRLDRYDARHLATGLERLAELGLAAGAERVRTLHASPLELRAGASPATRAAFEGAIRRASMAPNRVGLFSAHQMGTARMARDVAGGVVDPAGRVGGCRGLLVVDGSAFPLASGVNPMLTIAALARRTATQAVERLA
ncbi:MAG TPA: GMC family oxidoreductase N-terminal domain-containing protein [Candidatus Baltobacteraceae bacterium]